MKNIKIIYCFEREFDGGDKTEKRLRLDLKPWSLSHLWRLSIQQQRTVIRQIVDANGTEGSSFRVGKDFCKDF
jgi:hypothetical protein